MLNGLQTLETLGQIYIITKILSKDHLRKIKVKN